MSKPAIWRLTSGSDRRFRAGHPWVYSNELEGSPKGIEPGAPVELRDPSGKFLARGFGNPGSLIAFRALSRDAAEEDVGSVEFFERRFRMALRLRVLSGLAEFSHRLCFGEADLLPGLIVDRYLTSDKKQVTVIQAHAAGMDRCLSQITEALERVCPGTALVIRNDLSVRKLEGIVEESPRVLRDLAGANLNDIRIRVRPARGENALLFSVDLIEGQKTGFFLDQSANIRLALERLSGLASSSSGKAPRLRILDLFCYVGQWGTQFARFFKEAGVALDVVCVDSSARALEFAKRNVEAEGARCETVKSDILKDLASYEADKAGNFDVVICDPPALIKGRKDIPTGKHAYLQANTQVFRLVKRGGGVVSCSCSGLMEEEDFVSTLGKAATRNQASVRWVGRGAQAPDHPLRAEFPEGRYLKSWVGILDP